MEDLGDVGGVSPFLYGSFFFNTDLFFFEEFLLPLMLSFTFVELVDDDKEETLIEDLALDLEETEELTHATMLGPVEVAVAENMVVVGAEATALLPAHWEAEVAEVAQVGVLLASTVSLEMSLLLAQSALHLQEGWLCKSHRLTLCIARATLCS
jgi:hypothetical protein